MTDVRLTATTTDGEVVPVLSNTKGELLLEAPIAPPEFDGNLDGDLNVTGKSNFAGDVQVGGDPENGSNVGIKVDSDGLFVVTRGAGKAIFAGHKQGSGNATSVITAAGNATFDGEVIIGSKSKKWLIRESNGVAMLIDQETRQPRMTKVRDLPRELDLIEAALNEIMDKLKMTPPAGWEVWDGSDNS